MGEKSQRLKHLASWNSKCHYDNSDPYGESVYKFREHPVRLKNVMCKCCGDVFIKETYALSFCFGVKNEIGQRQWRINMSGFRDNLKKILSLLLCPECERDYKKRRRRSALPLFETILYKIKNYDKENKRHAAHRG